MHVRVVAHRAVRVRIEVVQVASAGREDERAEVGWVERGEFDGREGGDDVECDGGEGEERERDDCRRRSQRGGEESARRHARER